MAEEGRVIEIKGNLAVVSMTRTEACAHCNVCKRSSSSQEMIIEALNECEAIENDYVTVELKDNGFIKATMLAYALPLLMFFIGIWGGYILSPILGLSEYQELVSFVVGILLVIATYLFIKSQEKRWKSGAFMPIATEIVKKAGI